MPTSAPEILEDCLGLLGAALIESRSRRFDEAKQAWGAALVHAVELPAAFRPEFRAAHFYCLLFVQSRKDPASVTPEIRSKASALLEECQPSKSSGLFQELMFEILTGLGEYRRAIPLGERGLALAIEKKESVPIGDWLWKIGGCYSRLGLRDHAALAYRGSVRIFRNETADPRLPVVLLALGNSIRKSAPSGAEGLYKEAAALWEKKGQLESATPAWTNLSIVCSDQGRFEEAITYLERVRQVRESYSATPPVRIGVLYNNLASCYRKMKRYADAHQAIERSIGILTQPSALGPNDGNSLAASLGTKGMILRDQGRDSESLEWFRRACAEFERQPAPNLEDVIEQLEHEAVALTRLNRMDEARAVEERIKSVRKISGETPCLSHDGDAPVELPEAALFIELDGGIRSETAAGEIAKLGDSLDQILKEQDLGECQGLIRGLEFSTLIYYGSNAVAMYTAIEPTLRGNSRFAGALITLRQGADQREVVVPPPRIH